MKTIGIIATTLMVMAFSVTINGWALSVLWKWFIVPVFGAPILTIPAAIGVAMVVNYLTEKINMNNKDEREWGEKLFVGAFLAIAKPSFALLFGWIVLQFA